MTKNIHVQYYGCSANKSDTEILVGLLKEADYNLTNLDRAEYVLVNTCGVKKPTEDRMISKLKELSSLKKKLIICGCLPKINYKRIMQTVPDFSAMMDTNSVHKIVEVLKNIEEGKDNLVCFSESPPIKPSLPKHSFNPVIGIIQISEGCNNACTYCSTRFARGSLNCFPYHEIIKESSQSIEKGFKEIWLTSQDNSNYNYNGNHLPDLLQKICRIEGDFYIRVGMMNPENVNNVLPDLVESYLDKKIFKFLHLPIQSASYSVLQHMNRGYSTEIVNKIVNRFMKITPFLTLSTDIIVGYPTETHADFEETKNFVQKIKPDIVNISKFGARPNTEAQKMEPLPSKIIDERCKELVQLVRQISYEKNQNWLNWNGRCIIDEVGKISGTWIGRNFAYKPIVVKNEHDILGRFVDVEVVEARSSYLIARIK